MTERSATASAEASATAKTNTGVLRFAQDDGEKQTTASAKTLQVSPLRRKSAPSVEMTEFGGCTGKKQIPSLRYGMTARKATATAGLSAAARSAPSVEMTECGLGDAREPLVARLVVD
jgi:hypothetical protein